ncbi:retrovirus-related pol polyprotein from transposon TNT 1-94 [Tanacetum coccineum]
MSRTMLNEQLLQQKFWCNDVDTSTYIFSRILIRAILEKTPYELLRCRKHTLDYFKVFKRKCFILNTKYYLTKFDPNSNEGVFLNYSQNSKAYIILNKHTIKIEESLNVTFDETPPSSKTSPLVDDDLDEEEAIKVTEKKNIENDIERNFQNQFLAPLPGIEPNDDYASSDDDPLYSEDIDYVDASHPDSELVSLEEVKDFDTEDEEINTDILLTIKDDILREKLLNINLLIAKIEALKDNPTPSTDSVLKSPS